MHQRSFKMESRRRGVSALLAFGLLFAAGCASPSSRISNELGHYGLDANQALCVGQRLESNLSLAQLQQLARAAAAFKTGDTSPGRLTASDLLRVGAQIKDPKVAIEVARAASSCGVVSSIL